jgi:transcriptional regulator of arginine metabolism
VPSKTKRHAAILRLVREHAVPSQEALREFLVKEGFDVTQATLSRDIRELGLVKLPDAEGYGHYETPEEAILPAPPLSAMIPSLLLKAEGVGPLLVLSTPTGSASALAAALDHEEWPEVLGSIAGDDTLLIIARSIADRKKLEKRVDQLVPDRR